MKVALLLVSLCAATARASDVAIDFNPAIGAALPLTAQLRDERGAEVRLGDYFHRKRPVILALVYFECPMLCTLTLNGLLRGLALVSYSAGRDFDVVAVSIAPAETWKLAAKKKRRLLDNYRRPGAFDGWHLLTGVQGQIDLIAKAAGFKYRFEPRTGQYYHASGILILTPDGRISRPMFGVEYGPEDLRLALLEASRGRLGSIVERALLYCYRYDPAVGRYSLKVLALVRAAAALTVAGLVALLLGLRRVEAA
jgi:protein SCO1